MRALTWKGFLAAYLKELSFGGTTDIKILAEEAAGTNARLRVVLLLYAEAHGKTQILRNQFLMIPNGETLIRMLDDLTERNVEEALEHGRLPEEYLKVWNSFLVRKNAPKREEELKEMMREKILKVQREKGCTNYRIYTDLKLNPGNINSWLKHGDHGKVGYETAERILDYVNGY